MALLDISKFYSEVFRIFSQPSEEKLLSVIEFCCTTICGIVKWPFQLKLRIRTLAKIEVIAELFWWTALVLKWKRTGCNVSPKTYHYQMIHPGGCVKGCSLWVNVKKKGPSSVCAASSIVTELWVSGFNGDMCASRTGLMEIWVRVCVRAREG